MSTGRVLALTTACLALVATACGGGDPSADGATAPVVLVGPGASAPSLVNLQSNLFVEGGYGGEHGIEVTQQTAPGPQSLTALQSGQNEFVLTNPAIVFNAANAGVPLKIVASYSTTFPTAIVSTKDVTSVDQLAGRTIVVSTLGDVPQIYTNAYLSGSGLVDPKAVKYSGAGNNSNALAYLNGGKADAAWVTGPNLPAVLKNPNLHVLVTADEFAEFAPSTGTVLVVTEEFARTNKDRVQKVVDMVIGGNRKLHDDESAYVALAQKMMPGVYSDDEAHKQYRDLQPSLSVNGGMVKSVFDQSFALWLKYTAPNTGKPVTLRDAASVLDPSFASATVKALGKRSGVGDTGDLLASP